MTARPGGARRRADASHGSGARRRRPPRPRPRGPAAAAPRDARLPRSPRAPRGPARRPRSPRGRHGRAPRREVVPRRGPGPGRGRQACWIARDAEIGDRVADELVAWLGDPDGVAVLEPRSALAYERSELIRDESAARVATLARWRSGRARILVASVQALLQPTITPADLPPSPRVLRRGDRLRQDALLGELLRLGYEPVLEVAGRGEMARRGGLVDLFPAGADLPARIELFGDEIDEIRLFDPTDQRTVRPVEAIELLPANEFLVPAAGIGEIRARLGRLADRLPERLAADLARLEGAGEPAPPAAAADRRRAGAPPAPAPSTWATRQRSGRPSSARRAASTTWAPTRSSSSTSRARSPPRPSSSGSRPRSGGATSWAPASSPREWPSAYVEPRAWKARLLGARTLELTWESGPVDGDRRCARPRRPVRLARAGPTARTQRRPGPGDRALAGLRPGPGHRPRLGPGHPPGRAARRGGDPRRASRWPRAPRRRAPSPWSGAA